MSSLLTIEVQEMANVRNNTSMNINPFNLVFVLYNIYVLIIKL